MEKEELFGFGSAQVVWVPEILEHGISLFLPKLAEIGPFCDPVLVGFVLSLVSMMEISMVN